MVPAVAVVVGGLLVILAIVLRSLTLGALAVVAFTGLMGVLIVFTLPAFRYKQKVRYDHSFLTNLFGGTSTPHHGPGAERDDD